MRNKLKFKATMEQFKEFVAAVVNASIPMGLGIFQYNPSVTFKPDDIEIDFQLGSYRIDYFQGRMVKLWVDKDEDHFVLIYSGEDYQSWLREYPDPTDLMKQLGIEIVEDED